MLQLAPIFANVNKRSISVSFPWISGYKFVHAAQCRYSTLTQKVKHETEPAAEASDLLYSMFLVI